MAAVAQMTYRPGRESTASVEVLSFTQLRRRNDGGTQRADFHVLGLVSAGTGAVSIDFARHRLTPRSAVWIPPGAVHRWDEISDVTGLLVLFIPTAPVTPVTRELAATRDRAAAWPIDAAGWPLLRAAARHLESETRVAPADVRAELPGLLLSALLLRLDPPAPARYQGSDIFRAFQSELEARFREHHDVGYYARALGYAPRTLSRAVQKMTGTTAKAYITERLVLEAKRLLAHDRLTSHRCAAALGFRDASNFSAFFLNATGQRPSAWQDRYRARIPTR